MNYCVDMHVHTTHSDGGASVFEMGKAAFERGIRLLGFSDHAYVEHPDGTNGFGIRGEELDAYINDVYTLQDMYLGKMTVMCGLEAENLSGFSYIDEFQDSQLNYLIGSTHNLEKDGIGFEVDHSEELLVNAVNQLYGGDYYELVKDYYATEAKVVETTQCSIIGHLDLITKFNEGGRLFDENCPAYQKPALDCIEQLLTADIPFEINTGAISRGIRKDPYPSRWLLEELSKRGGRIVLNSDAHDPLFLGYHFEESLKLAWDCGFRKVSAITPEGEQELAIEE